MEVGVVFSHSALNCSPLPGKVKMRTLSMNTVRPEKTPDYKVAYVTMVSVIGKGSSNAIPDI